MNTTAAVANLSTPSNKHQKQTATEVIAANIRRIAIEAQLRDHPERIKDGAVVEPRSTTTNETKR